MGFKIAVFGSRLLLVYVLAHVFSPADYGAYALVTTMNSFGVFLLGLNLYNYVYRAAPGRPLGERAAIFKSTLCFETVLAALLVALTLVSGALAPILRVLKASEYRGAFVIGLALLVGLVVLAEVQHYLWAKTEIEHNNRVDVVQNALWILPLFVLWRSGWRISVSGVFAANLAAVALAIFYGFRRIEVSAVWRARPNLKVIRTALIFSVPMIVPAFSEYALRIADRVILSSYRSLYEVGLYSFACSFLSTIFAFTASILFRTMVPHAVEAHNQGNLERRNYLLTYALKCSFLTYAGAAITLLIFCRPILGFLARPEYMALIRVMPLVALSYALLTVSCPAHYLLMLENRTTLLMGIDFLGMAIGLSLDFLLVPRWSYYGAAVASVAGFATVAALKHGCSRFWRHIYWADLLSFRPELRFVSQYFRVSLPAAD